VTRTLRQQQSRFCKLIGILIAYVFEHEDWELTLADGYRGDQSGHEPGSLHYIRLAQDLNLFVDGSWKYDDCPEWRVIGSYWESLDPDARWGGRFAQRDLNHFSLTWAGRQ
jgi:hypothetical protein